ncbi:hypothetical protein [Caballeronia sp.]|jgi:hypothetical protein
MKKLLCSITVAALAMCSTVSAFADEYYHHHHRECHNVRVHHHWERHCR